MDRCIISETGIGLLLNDAGVWPQHVQLKVALLLKKYRNIVKNHGVPAEKIVVGKIVLANDGNSGYNFAMVDRRVYQILLLFQVCSRAPVCNNAEGSSAEIPYARWSHGLAVGKRHKWQVGCRAGGSVR